MSTTTSSFSSDRGDELRSVRSDEPIVLGPDDYVVVERRTSHDRLDSLERLDSTVQRVTAARGSHTEDVGRRMRNYAFSMGIRTLCVIAFIVSFPHWWAWLFVPSAVLLPYVAVVIANAGRERTPSALSSVQTSGANLPVLRTTGPA